MACWHFAKSVEKHFNSKCSSTINLKVKYDGHKKTRNNKTH